jgi:histidine triad (HIT) family protein
LALADARVIFEAFSPWSIPVSDADCIFCKIIRGEIPGRFIDRNNDVVVFLSLDNHPLIVTNEHVADIFGLSDRLGAAVMSEAVRIAKAMRAALSPDGIHITQSNGEAAGQEVFHYHMHLYPHWTHRRGLDESEAGKDRMAQSLKDALANV